MVLPMCAQARLIQVTLQAHEQGLAYEQLGNVLAGTLQRGLCCLQHLRHEANCCEVHHDVIETHDTSMSQQVCHGMLN